jgi:hypothetical protein
VPRRPITHPDPRTQKAITNAADRDFVQGIRVALLVAVAALLAALAAGWRWFPRGHEPLREAESEEARLAVTEE